MATGKAAQILDALFARVATLEIGSPTLPVAYPEQAEDFDPPADGKYLEVAVFPNRPAWEGVTDGKLDQGLLQIKVVWPKNQGLIAPAEAVQAVKDHFAKGTTLISGSTRVKVSVEPWDAAPLTEKHEVSIPVTIPWTA